MVVCIRNGRQDSLYQPVGGTAGISGLTAAIQRTNNEQCSRPQSDCVGNGYQNLRFFLTASRFSSWMCSVSGISFGQTLVQENWV